MVMGAAGLLGAIAVIGAEMAGSLNLLIVAQFLAGAAWGCMLMSALASSLPLLCALSPRLVAVCDSCLPET